MSDLLFLLITILFFLASLGIVRVCQGLQEK